MLVRFIDTVDIDCIEQMDDAQHRARALKRAQLRQVTALELQLETTPRDSRFSNTLLDLMKKEESSIREGSSAVVQKVDEMLRQETKAFFNKVVGQNTRRWAALEAKLTEERRALRPSTAQAPPAMAAAPSKPAQYTAADLDREAERLDVDYFRNWQRYEGLHLQEAFKSQAAKIDHEWGTHEAVLLADFQEKRDRLIGRQSPAPSPQQPSAAADDKRWHHPEKQQTLIHTAPVLSPQRPVAQRRPSASSLTELARAQRDYDEALAGLHKQKADAKRWLLRQQIRFTAQSEELQREKALVAQVLEGISSLSS